jgi:Putative transposase
VVYAKAPFSGPEEVLEYAARYTHRVAISNDRILHVEDEKVQFRWRDYRDGNRNKVMTVTAEEFIRRFLLHVLPEGFQRIRHYGFLANRYRQPKLARCRELLKMPPLEPKSKEKNKDYRDYYEELTGTSLKTCPICHQGHMAVIEIFEGLHPLDQSMIPHDHDPYLTIDLSPNLAQPSGGALIP